MTRHERRRFQLDRSELERRWSLLRAELKARHIGALVIQSRTEENGGNARWLTDVPAANYPRTVIFHADDLMTIVEHGPAGRRRTLDGNDTLYPGVGEIVTNAALPAIDYTQDYDAASAAEVLLKRGYKTIAFAAPGGMAHGLVAGIERRIAGKIEIADLTLFLDRCKAEKSDYEISLIRETAAMQDEIFRRVLPQIRPGLRESDIFSLCQHEGQKLGSTGGIFLGGSAPLDEPVTTYSRFLQGRTLQAGEHISILIENNSESGFYTELSRSIVLGKASAAMQEAYDFALAAELHTVGMCRPGVACAEIFARHGDYMRANGREPTDRLYAHSQGYDLVERPLIRNDETMAITHNMNLAVHPGLNPPFIASSCNNYLITDGGQELLHKTENRIFEI